jgi:hypothetical protein
MGFMSRNNRHQQAAANIDQVDSAERALGHERDDDVRTTLEERAVESSLAPEQRDTSRELQQECPHSALVPRWASAADMGKQDRISEYLCEACNSTLPPDEGRRAMANEAVRLRA